MAKRLHFLLGVLLQVSFATAQTHFTFTSNTGNNATVAITTSTNPNIGGSPLQTGDEIGVFTPAGLCVGAVVWQGTNTAITVWGDNDQTPEIDGIRVGEQILYRVWRQSSNTEFPQVNVTYSQGNGIYAVNGIYVLESMSVFLVNVDKNDGAIPGDFRLFQNYPNPFNPGTTIRFVVPRRSHVTMKVYSPLGQEITELVNEEKHEGLHEVYWYAGDIPSGLYFCSLKAETHVETKKLMLLR